MYSSITFRIRSLPLRTVVWWTKSHVYMWFLCVAFVAKPVLKPTRCAFGFFPENNSPSSQR
ncbi:MAG: hypothetical protein AAGH99_05320 [Planctomycetota bacterium]